MAEGEGFEPPDPCASPVFKTGPVDDRRRAAALRAVCSLQMKNEFTAIVERDGSWYVAYCPEIPGANGQGAAKAECLNDLKAAVELILQDRREDGLRGIPDDAEREVIVVG